MDIKIFLVGSGLLLSLWLIGIASLAYYFWP